MKCFQLIFWNFFPKNNLVEILWFPKILSLFFLVWAWKPASSSWGKSYIHFLVTTIYFASLWWREIVLKHEKVYKYFVQDWRFSCQRIQAHWIMWDNQSIFYFLFHCGPQIPTCFLKCRICTYVVVKALCSLLSCSVSTIIAWLIVLFNSNS